ncbi:hypothetical protein K488DRAFT_84516 [Vararia minispora EC-137]|uniref:Uncharacterized protein n=1 Tax=Vararia minispora EC-137 TaxID=1314806 RepID=A0ACB8QQN7_9AGAM|nr:hypothetical protein K488DRAFT_84516 [Vararia minispora EC-137]
MSINTMPTDFASGQSAGEPQTLNAEPVVFPHHPLDAFVNASDDLALTSHPYWPSGLDVDMDDITAPETLDSPRNFLDLSRPADCPIVAPRPMLLPPDFEATRLVPAETESPSDFAPAHTRPHPHNAPRTRDGTQHARVRTHHACEPCRKRKAKCTGTTPCERCGSRDLSCIYSVERRMRGPNKPKPLLLVRTGQAAKRRITSHTSYNPPSPPSPSGWSPSSPSTSSSATTPSLPGTPPSVRTHHPAPRGRAATIATSFAPPSQLSAFGICGVEMPSVPFAGPGMLTQAARFDMADGLLGPEIYIPAHNQEFMQHAHPVHHEIASFGGSQTMTPHRRPASVSLTFDSLSLRDSTWAEGMP